MEVDIAQLGLAVRSDGVVVASDRLEDLEKKARKTETAAQRLEKQFEKTSKTMKTFGKNMSVYVTAPLLAAAVAAVKIGSDFDSAMVRMITLVGLSRDEVAGFRKEILLLAPAVGKGPVELADALFAVTSAGARGAQAMEILRASATAAAIGLGNTREIALAVTAAITAYGAENLSAADAVDIMVGTVEQGNLAAEDLAGSLGKVLGLAAQAGATFQDVGAFIASFTRQGVKAAEAVTGLRGVLALLTREATSETEAALKEMNTTIEEVRANVQKFGFIKGFQQLVTQADAAGISMARIVPEVEALVGTLSVFNSKGQSAAEIYEAVGNAVGTLSKRFKEMQELDPTFAIAQARAELQAMFISISQDLIPVVLDLTHELRDLIQGFNELPVETQRTIVKALALTAALGPLFIVLGSIVGTIGTLLPLFAKLRTALALAHPVTAAALALGVMVDYIGDWYIAKIEEGIGSTKRFTTAVEELGTAAGQQINLDAIDDNIEITRKKIEQFKKTLLEDFGGETDRFRISIYDRQEFNDLIFDLEQAEREMVHFAALREKYLAGVANFTKKVMDPAIVQELAEAFKFLDGLSGTQAGPKFDVEAFEELRDALLPTEKAMRDLEAAKDALDTALAVGHIDTAEYDALTYALNRSKMAFDAFKIDTKKDFNAAIAADLEASMAYVDSLQETEQAFEQLKRQLDPTYDALQQITDARKLLNEVTAKGIIEDPKELQRWTQAIDDFEASVNSLGQRLYDVTSLLGFAFSTMAQNLEEGSGLQRAFSIAAEAANAVLAIQAILNQGAGDPYSAFARMAAMAAVVASLGIRVASIAGGGGTDTTAKDRQELQGTGGVLGDSLAKSESILKATQITADATSELVGINRGMLHALQSLQQGIEGAVVKLARGEDADFGPLPKGLSFDLLAGSGKFDLLGLNFVGEFLSKLLGGSAKVVDQGVQILGGTLDEIVFQAFQTVKSKKHIFASTKIRDSFQDLDDELTTQFALILGSIGDTVREAALALGLPLELIEQRIADFEIEAQKISFKDLTAEEQRDELLAVFSKIFDDLAGDVVPFIDQFQKVGEGLGETLVRVATSVQVFQQAINALGLVVDETDPEKFAQMSVELVELTGGIESFISQFSTFFDKFASDEQKLAFATEQLTSAFDQAGLVIPDTRDGMIDLMQSLDASTESGRQQIATLLRLADVADEYYDLVAAAEASRLAQAEAALQLINEQRQLIEDFTGAGPSAELVQLRNRFDEAMDAADALGASQREYAMIARAFDLELSRMAARLTISILNMTKTLFGSGAGAGSAIPPVEQLEEVREVSNRLFTDWQRALEDILEFTQELLLDDELTTLTPAQKLAEAQSQFNAILSAAQSGDVEAAQALPDAAKALLEEARFMFASGSQYQAVFDQVLAALNGIEMPDGIPEFIREVVTSPGGAGQDGGITEQDKLIEALEAFLLATDLAIALRELSHVMNVSVIQLADQLGVPLEELVEILGVELSNLSAETAAALAGVAQLLGADIYELMEALNVSLAELAVASGVQLGMMSKALAEQLKEFAELLGVNVLDLATRLDVSLQQLASVFGVSIEDFQASQFQALSDFSNALGVSVNEVATVLGISLGQLSDSTSLLSQALDLAIAELPAAIQADLGPLLDAIRDATTQADANAAIQNLGDYVLSLPPDIGAELIPFLEAIGYILDQSEELSALQNIAGKIDTGNSLLSNVISAINALGGTLSQQFSSVNNTVNAMGATVNSVDRAVGSLSQSTDSRFRDVDRALARTVDSTDAVNGLTSDIMRLQFDMGRINDSIASMGGFAEGGPVNRTGIYQLHDGEFVVRSDGSNLAVAEPNSQLSNEDLRAIRRVLEDIRDRNSRYQQEDLKVAKGIESGVKLQAEKTRRANNG